MLMKSIPTFFIKVVIILFFSSVSNAQDYQEIERLILADGANAEKRLDFIFRREFSKVINANVNGLIGNHVGLSTEDQTLSIGYNHVSNNNVFEFTFSGKVNDGVAGIFEENKFQKGVSLGLTFNRFFTNKNSKVVESDVLKLKDELLALKYEFALKFKDLPQETKKIERQLEEISKDSIALEKRKSLYYGKRYDSVLDDKKNNRLLMEKAKLELEVLMIQSEIDERLSSRARKLQQLEQAKAAVPPPTKSGLIKISFDSLMLFEKVFTLHDTLNSKKKLLEKVIAELKANVFSQKALNAIEAEAELIKLKTKHLREKLMRYSGKKIAVSYNNEYEGKKNKILGKFDEVRVEEIGLTWVSFGGALSNESYDFFDRQRGLDDQIFIENDVVPSIEFGISNYVNKPKRGLSEINKRQVRFLTVGGEVNYGNNIADLSTVTIVSMDSVANNRTISSTQKAFLGDFNKGVVSSRVSFDYFQMPFSNNSVGYHFQTAVSIGSFKPKTSIRAGIVVSAIKKDTKTSIVNLELFYGLTDVFKDNRESKFLSRNLFGIQTTFPFNFSM